MRRILLVEDEDILRETYELILSTQPYLVDSAENGKSALKKCEKTEYDLILLDLMMPIMDGVKFLEHFTPDAPEHTKVIILSNLSSGNQLETAMKLGAERNVLKASLSPKQLVSMIRYELGTS